MRLYMHTLVTVCSHDLIKTKKLKPCKLPCELLCVTLSSMLSHACGINILAQVSAEVFLMPSLISS